jgi:hypothetical protein
LTLSLPDALLQAERNDQAVTVSVTEGLFARVRLTEHGERQLAVYTKAGPASEAQAEAAATLAGFGRWDTERHAKALILTETEAADDAPPWEPLQAGPELKNPTEPGRLSVLQRVYQHIPLCQDDQAEVIRDMNAGLIHVTPEFDRKDICPYRLTDAGKAALRARG